MQTFLFLVSHCQTVSLLLVCVYRCRGTVAVCTGILSVWLFAKKALCSICIRYYLRHLPFVSLSVCVFVSGMIQQVVKVIDIRPHRRRAWTVQSYLPGGANVHSNLIVLAWAHSSPHPTRHLDRFSRFAQLSAVGRVISGPPLFPFKIGKWGFGPI